jgi:hypothetical protein
MADDITEDGMDWADDAESDATIPPSHTEGAAEELDEFDEDDFDVDFDDDFEEEEDDFDYGEDSFDEDLDDNEDANEGEPGLE